MPDVPVATPLEGVFPPRLVARLHRERFEGTLRLHGGGATRVLYFRRGEIASAASNADEDRLPNILIREGRLTGPQVEMARAKQRPGISLGKTLIELGFLTPAELLQGARRQVRQILAAAFALRDGTSQEAPGPLPPEVTVLGLPVRRLIFDALLEAGDRQAIVSEMGSMEMIYRPAAELAQALPSLRLEPQHEEVARLVDGEATLREISGRVRLDDLTVSKVVLALEILGLVERASAPEEPDRPALQPPSTPQGRRIPVLVEDDDEAPAPVVETTPIPAAPAPRLTSFEPQAAPPFAPSFSEARPPVPDPAPPIAPPAPPIAPPAPPIAASVPQIAASAPPIAASAASVFQPAPPVREHPAPPEPAPFAAMEDDEDDLPPIPPGELPAFATPANAPSGWSVDPETGEKVHMGPIELTFDGPVVPPGDKAGSRGRLALFAAAGALVAAAVLAFFALRGGGGGDDATRIASRSTSPGTSQGVDPQNTAPPGTRAGSPPGGDAQGGAPTAPSDGAPAGAAGTATGSTGAPADTAAPAPEATDAGASAHAPEQPPVVPETRTVPPGRQQAPPSPAPAPAPAPVTEPEHPADSAAVPHGSGGAYGFGFGQRLIDAGTLDRATEVFGRALGSLPRDHYTLQMMIACEGETVRKARAGTRPDEGLFVLPLTVRGRGCYRVMWGVFESKEAAARAALPPYFVSSGITPAVLAIDRLRPAS